MLLFLSHPSLKKYVAPDSCGDSSCGPNLQEPALSSKGTGKKLQHETWHLPLLQYFFYCNTHHYNFSFLQNLRVGTMACHVKLAVPSTTAAVGLLRCWYGIWNYRPLGDVKRYEGAQLPIFNLGFRRKFQERDIGPGAKLFWFKFKMHTLIQCNNTTAYVYSRWITLLQLLDPWCLSLSQYLLRNSIGGNNKQSWSIKTQVVSTCIDNKPMSTSSSSPQKISSFPFSQVASAPISQHPIGTRESEKNYLHNSTLVYSSGKRWQLPLPRGSIEDEGSGTQPWPPHHLLGGFASFASLASLASFVSLASATA